MVSIENQPVYLFALYRWAGTSPEEFRDHYLSKHADIGKSIPGVAWWHTFLNDNPMTNWGIPEGAPKPDAFSIMAFESEEALRKAPESEGWAAANGDNTGFVQHIDVYEVSRVQLVSEGSADD
ncbi:EthD family reductase [Dietzia sp. CH92]|uniref:EthD family reductase n=1 Tax=Dietzia sp. CH92 TaxID=3051823 RepID=UPI0028D5C0E3|nr:EthD family reductase [Dietzia sp. CH92]